MVERVGLLPLGRKRPLCTSGVWSQACTPVWCTSYSGSGNRLHPIHAVTPASFAEAPHTKHPCFWIFFAPSPSLFKLSHPVSGLTTNLAVTNSGAISELSPWRNRHPNSRARSFQLGYAPAARSSVPSALVLPFVIILAPARSSWPHGGCVVWT